MKSKNGFSKVKIIARIGSQTIKRRRFPTFGKQVKYYHEFHDSVNRKRIQKAAREKERER